MRYWVSWHEPSPDYRPIDSPPNDRVLGWWKSGEDGRCSVLCAVVDAKSPDLAMQVILKDWPEATDWRLVEPTGSDFVPSDRFPLEDWMRSRFRVGGGV